MGVSMAMGVPLRKPPHGKMMQDVLASAVCFGVSRLSEMHVGFGWSR